MVTRLGVQGTMETVPEVECNHDIVYLRTNIKRVEAVVDDEGRETTPAHWEYDEVEMTNTEYSQHVRELLTNDNLNNMEAVTMLFEGSLEQQEQSLFAMEAITDLYEQLLGLQETVLSLTGGVE